ncbi:hypothetical protein L1987_42442 [Smallanthus sonchifolius]|uniref:Uncharacterized protein n=1 Tax=Smallanthus sonchifolius TaxID=185202 RepID=A0ACB9GJY9_9ASTR|nr:hypothetical protein L1987_42442 [Smallanthus sonchifolius]
MFLKLINKFDVCSIYGGDRFWVLIEVEKLDQLGSLINSCFLVYAQYIYLYMSCCDIEFGMLGGYGIFRYGAFNHDIWSSVSGAATTYFRI